MQRRQVDGIRSPQILRSQPEADFQVKTVSHQSPKYRPSHHPLRKYSYIIGGICLVLVTGLSTLLIVNQRKLQIAFTYASNGIESLSSGMGNILISPAKAKADFDVGASSFATTASELQNLDDVSKSLLIFPYAREGVQLLRIAYHASLAGESLSSLLTDKPAELPDNATFEESVGSTTSWLSTWPEKHQAELENVLSHLEGMNELLAKIDANKLPRSIRSLVKQWQQQLPETINQAKAIASIMMQAPSLFDTESPSRYVILFQNSTELRPTGGFIGSYASTEFNNGTLTDFSVQTNVYKADKAFSTQHPIDPPFPLNESVGDWGMRDANWDIDFPTTAKQVMSFYNGIYGQPAQGVVAIDTSVITDLLQLTGPINFPEYQTSLSADNFIDTVQYKVEKEYFDDPNNKVENEPKKILADFIPKLFTALKNMPDKKKAETWKILAEAATRKSILAYVNNETIENAIIDLNVAGQVKSTTGDYLYINNANVAGGKSSANVDEKVEVIQKPLNNNIEVTLKITRTHHGNGVWPDQANNNYMRIMVPKDSTIIRYDDTFEYTRTTEESGKTVFGGWFRTPVASKKYAEITYQLPSNISSKNYSLLLQRQPGANQTTYVFDSPLINENSITLNSDTLLTDK